MVAPMDTSRLTTGELITGGAGVVLFISLFLDWIAGTTAWSIFDVTDIVLALCALVPVGLVVARATGNPLRLPFDDGRLVVVLGIIATTVSWTFVLESDRLEFGIFLSLLSALVLIYGGTQLGRRTVTPASAAPSSSPPTTPVA